MVLFVLTGRGPTALQNLPRRILTFQLLQQACRDVGMEMMITTPANVNGKRGVCHGWTMGESAQTISWTPKIAPMSGNVLYDAMYLRDLKVHRKAYKKVLASAQKHGCVVFNPKLPAKDELHQLLTEVDSISERRLSRGLVPASYLHVDVRQIKHLLRKAEQSMWLKPVHGSGGRNMLLIQPLCDGRYRVRGDRFFDRHVSAEWRESELVRHVQQALRRRDYLLQEDIDLLQTPDGRRVDFRVTLARGGTGEWEMTAITARYARAGGALTNFHAGGSIQSLTEVNEETAQALWELGCTRQELTQIANCAKEAAQRISAAYPLVGVLGIDVGVRRQDKAMYVYDCNSRPGRDILTDAEIARTMRQIAHFAQFLQSQSKRV